MSEECVFKYKYTKDCAQDSKALQRNSGPERILTIIDASQKYGDDLHTKLQKQLSANSDLTIFYHKNCVSRYTSKSNLAKYEQGNVQEEPPRKLRKSSVQFSFREHCLYCGEICDLGKDPKHPRRWRPAFLCRSTYSEHDKKPYKDFLLERCRVRNDEWASQVRLRLEGALDLHAADARYHRDCMCKFMALRNIHQTLPESETDLVDQGLEAVFRFMLDNKNNLWNSVELYDVYNSCSTGSLSRPAVIEKVKERFSDDVIILSSPGCASVIAFRSCASSVLKIVKDEKELDDLQHSKVQVAKCIERECMAMKSKRTHYDLHITKEKMDDIISPTLSSLLSLISPKLNKTLAAAMIGNIITSQVTNQATDMQIALGILTRDSKKVVDKLYDYRVTCSYDEVVRFKKSAARASYADTRLQGISDSSNGLIQIIADNFDADISSPNGKLSTHALAMIAIQPSEGQSQEKGEECIRRITKQEMSQQLPADDNLLNITYNCSKKPDMIAVPYPKVSKRMTKLQQVANTRAEENDLQFLRDVVSVENCPEYNGFNTRLCREQGHSIKPKTKVVYLPLMDSSPSDPATMMSSIVKAKNITAEAGQEYVVYTADQQLYRVALHLTWDNPDICDNVFLRLGGMHFLMSYIGCIGSLMAETGLEEVLSEQFGGVKKMMMGKKFPENVRAFRLLLEVLLKPIFNKIKIETMDDLKTALDNLTPRSRTTRLWVDCFVKPILTVLKYVRAEREADWPLHIVAVKEMMVLFFAAGHHNYARYGLHYARSIEAMPDKLEDQFIRGQHTMHHKHGIFNGIWSDMAIETTYMRYGHGHSGIIGLTMRQEALKTWAMSIHAVNTIISDLNAIDDSEVTSQSYHKEESKGRIRTDDADRNALLEKVNMSIDPLDPDQHPQRDLVNIVTGKVVSNPKVNVDQCIAIATSEMNSFEAGWPASFHGPIPKKVQTMAMKDKNHKHDQMMANTETLYARAMALHGRSNELDIRSLMRYELSSHPPSMFSSYDQMRESTSKSTLKNAIKVEAHIQIRNLTAEARFLDGCAVLWAVSWPVSGTVQDYLDNFRNYLENLVTTSDVYLIFDRWMIIIAYYIAIEISILT